MSDKTDFLYPYWMIHYPRPFGHQNKLQVICPSAFRSGYKVELDRNYLPSSTSLSVSCRRSDILYGLVATPRLPCMDASSAAGHPEHDTVRQRQREMENGNRRPLHKTSSCPLVEKVNLEPESSAASFTSFHVKRPMVRANGSRGNFFSEEQFMTKRTTNSDTVGDCNELIAMGTMYSPVSNNTLTSNAINGESRTSQIVSTSSSSSIINKSVVLGPSSTQGGNNSIYASQRKALILPARLVNGPSSNVTSNSVSGFEAKVHANNSSNNSNSNNNNNNNGNISNNNKDSPKYPDPLVGAPTSFQHRLMELASLEAETIRWERARRTKRKSKQERDA